MYSKGVVTVKIKNAYTFETYSLDWVSGANTQKIDLGSSIFTALQPSLKGMYEWKGSTDAYVQKHALRALPPSLPAICDVKAIQGAAADKKGIDDAIASVVPACFKLMDDLQNDSTKVYSQIQIVIWPDTKVSQYPTTATDISLPSSGTGDDKIWEVDMACELFGQTKPDKTVVLKNSGRDLPCPDKLPVAGGLYSRLFQLSSTLASINTTVNPANAPPITQNQDLLSDVQILVDSKTSLDATRSDLLAFGTRIDALVKNPPIRPTVVGEIPTPPPSRTQIPSVTYNVNALNLVLTPSSKTDNTEKKLVLPITVVYGDARWEVSAGTFFSSLPVRSFSASPTFQSGMPDTVTDKIVTQSALRPLVIPFAAVNFRISDDWTRPRWRTNFFWSGAIGINPNTVTTDFATGPSFAYRLLMFSAFWHIGHDVRLTPGSGVAEGDHLGASFSGTLPTQNFWTFKAYAIGISIRTPSLTGR